MERREGGWSLDHGLLSMPSLTKFCFKYVTQISTCFDFEFYRLKMHWCRNCYHVKSGIDGHIKVSFQIQGCFEVLGYLISELNIEIYHCSSKLGGSSRLWLYPERQISTC